MDGYLASGQLEMLTTPNWYLDPAGPLNSLEEIAAALPAKQDRALAKGSKVAAGGRRHRLGFGNRRRYEPQTGAG
jgi:hypothetical protein